jgi:hypothetical protein
MPIWQLHGLEHKIEKMGSNSFRMEKNDDSIPAAAKISLAGLYFHT